MNNISLFGRLTAEPELKTSGENKYIRFCVAVDRRTKDKKTDFIDCIVWNKLAEVMSKYVHKGNQITITGSLETGSYDKNGETRKTFVVRVNEFDFVGSSKESQTQPAPEHQFEPNFEVKDGELPFDL